MKSKNLSNTNTDTSNQRGLKAGMAAIRRYINYDQHKYTLIKKYCQFRKTELALRKIHGNKMYLKVNDVGLSYQLLTQGTRERIQTELVKKLLKPGMITLDIGANLGYYALIEASMVGKSGKVYAVEPVPETFEILSRNVRLNNYEDRMELCCAAVSDRCGTSKIALTDATNCATMFFDNNEISEKMEKTIKARFREIMNVKTITVDDFFKDKTPPDFMRMDVEGYEITILKGMHKTLIRSRKGTALFVELHACMFKQKQTVVDTILQTLTDSGFKIKNMVDSSGTRMLDFADNNALTTILNGGVVGVFWQKEQDR